METVGRGTVRLGGNDRKRVSGMGSCRAERGRGAVAPLFLSLLSPSGLTFDYRVRNKTKNASFVIRVRCAVRFARLLSERQRTGGFFPLVSRLHSRYTGGLALGPVSLAAKESKVLR